MRGFHKPDPECGSRSRRRVWLVICAGLAFLAVGVAIIRHGLKNLSEGRNIPSEISRLEKSIIANSDRTLKATLDGFTTAANALESARVNLEKKAEGLKRQRATGEEEIKRLKIEEAKAEEERKKNELEWKDWLPLLLAREPVWGMQIPVQKLIGQAWNNLKRIRDLLEKAKQADAILREQIDDIVETRLPEKESQLMMLKYQSESALKDSERQLKNFLNSDPRLVQLRARMASADGFGRVLQVLHLLTGSLCILMACKTAIRAMQLAGRLAPHTLVRQVRSNG